MSLFVINRYEGENQAQEVDDKKHLSDLLKKIEERKRQRAAGLENGVHEELQPSEKEVIPKKKRKKKKEVIQESELTEADNKDHCVDSTELNTETSETPKKKVKRKKSKTQNGELPDETVESNETIGNNADADIKQQNAFMVLGTDSKKKVKEVRRVLPDWLAHPQIISADLNSGPSLEELKDTLDPKLIEILEANGIKKLFPVQSSIISWMLQCSKDRKDGWWVRDTCVSAPTGSGKTLAYVLPIVQELQNRLVPKIRCLIVVPVQELATQVFKVTNTYASHTNLVVRLLSGAYSFEQEQNTIMNTTIRGDRICAVDIIVATPGRLVDHILKTPGFSLDALKFLVIDEADRSAEWLQYLPEPHHRVPPLNLNNLKHSKPPAQKLLFSATLSQDPEKLSRLGLFQPILFTSVVVTDKDGDVNLDREVGDFIGRYTSPEGLTELAVESSPEYKPLALYSLITKSDDISKTLVFTNSGDTAHRLAILLQSFLCERNTTVSELSAQLMPKQRNTVLKRFADGDVQVLVSSDALARGLDIPDVQIVVSYDLPKHIKGYIHRIGRTGRAGKLGTAVSVLVPNQVKLFKQMLTTAHKTVPEIEKLDLDSVANTINYQHHVEKLKEALEKEKQENLGRIKAAKRVQANHVQRS